MFLFRVYFPLSQSTRCSTPLFSVLIVKKKDKEIVTTIPSLLSALTALISAVFIFVCFRLSVLFCVVEAQASVVHPHAVVTHTDQRKLPGRSPVIQLIKTRKTRGDGCVVFPLCAVLLHYASCDT